MSMLNDLFFRICEKNLGVVYKRGVPSIVNITETHVFSKKTFSRGDLVKPLKRETCLAKPTKFMSHHPNFTNKERQTCPVYRHDIFFRDAEVALNHEQSSPGLYYIFMERFLTLWLINQPRAPLNIPKISDNFNLPHPGFQSQMKVLVGISY